MAVSHAAEFLDRKTTKTDFGQLAVSYAVDFPIFSTKKNRHRISTAILAIFLEKATGWGYRFSLSKRYKPGHCTLSHVRTSGRTDACGRPQAKVGLLLGLAGGQKGVKNSLYTLGRVMGHGTAVIQLRASSSTAMFPPMDKARRLHIAVQKSAFRPCIHMNPS